MQRKQHMEDVKTQKDNTATENKEEPGGKEKLKEENLPKKSEQGKQFEELEEEKQLTRVEKPKKKQKGSSNFFLNQPKTATN